MTALCTYVRGFTHTPYCSVSLTDGGGYIIGNGSFQKQEVMVLMAARVWVEAAEMVGTWRQHRQWVGSNGQGS